MSLISSESCICKKVCALLLLGMVTFSSSIYSADTCTTIVGNLAGSNCGFDNPSPNGTLGWSALAGGLTATSSGLTSPTGNPFGLINAASAVYDIRSPIFSLVGGFNANISLILRTLDTNTVIGQINLISTVGGIVINLGSNINVTTSSWLSLNYVAPIGVSGTYRVAINSTGGITSAGQLIALDSLKVLQTLPVPEPTTMILLGSLCSAVVGYKWKRKQGLAS